jgi:hypothetical protein
MHYISLLVHEAVDVIENQLQNFAKYASEMHVVIHVSPSAKFSPAQLHQFISGIKSPAVSINPEQVPSKWGAIIEAHLSNIKLIEAICNANDAVAFHSSNDMLVRPGLGNYLSPGLTLFHERPITSQGLWWVGNTAMQDSRLANALGNMGARQVFGSQIEGSVYPISALKEIRRIIHKFGLCEHEPFYPREEILFPTIARAIGIRPSGTPYIFSAIHRFDRHYWDALDRYAWLLNYRTFIHDSLKRKMRRRIEANGAWEIRWSDIEMIRQNGGIKETPLTMNDRGDTKDWTLYQPDSCYGVKRIARDLNDPLRQSISNLP